MKVIPLTQGKVALVSDADYWLARQFKWSAMRNRRAGTWYAQTNVGGRTVLMHRLLASEPPFEIDHKSRDGLDNQRGNLRLADRSTNQANNKRRTDNSSGFKGVGWFKRARKFRARIKVKGKEISLGLHLTPQRAHTAYLAAARTHFGEYARAA